VQEGKVEHKQIIAKIKSLGLKRCLSRMVGNDRGVVLVFALMLMLVLTIIGSSATMTSQVDLKISGNTKVIRTSFYVADGGIMGFAMDSAYQSADAATTDISMDQGTLGNMAIDITRTATHYLSGGGVEFAAGTEGVGVGGAASAAIIYSLASRGTVGASTKTTESDIVASYRKVAGVAGGR
jgi:hypothetical protein